MSIRAIQARVECDRPTLERLWLTHRIFNERLPVILSFLFRMRRGECGDTVVERKMYHEIADFILTHSQEAPYLFNAVSIKGWKPGTAVKQSPGSEWPAQAAQLSKEGKLLYDKSNVLGDLPGTLQQMVCRESAAIISGHHELVRMWEAEHAQWLEDKSAWEADAEHQKYLALRPRFDAFEQEAGGPAGKRRGRWHLYLNWLKQNPDLAAWRGGKPEVIELSPAARRRVERAKPNRQRSVEAEEFWKGNPELSALDRLHGYYEREFVRRRKTKKNADGFKHRPTFTLPHPRIHPRWFVFNAPQTQPSGYADLVLPTKPGEEGSVRMLVINAEKANGKYPSEWVRIRFHGDPRLCNFRAVSSTRTISRGKDKGKTKESPSYVFRDRHLGQDRPATISGIKLIFRTNTDRTPKAAYLYFACTIDDLPQSDAAKSIQWTETGEITSKGKKRKNMKVPDGLVGCAVDLGIRNLGFATLARYADGQPQILRSRNIWVRRQEAKGAHTGRWSAGADLAHIGEHKRTIRRLRRQRGKPVKDEKSHVGLQLHIDHMGEDRFKQAARAIINFALNADGDCNRKTGEVHPRADVLVLENLGGLIPDAEKEHGINRALVNWNRGQLVERIKEMAQDVGLKVLEVSPVGTSQVCCKCGSLGRRYSVVRNEDTGRLDIRFGQVEKLFACPASDCPGREAGRPDRPFTCNADYNASANLHRCFLLRDQAVKTYRDWRSGGDSKKAKEERETKIRNVEDALLGPLRIMHGMEDAPPF